MSQKKTLTVRQRRERQMDRDWPGEPDAPWHDRAMVALLPRVTGTGDDHRCHMNLALTEIFGVHPGCLRPRPGMGPILIHLRKFYDHKSFSYELQYAIFSVMAASDAGHHQLAQQRLCEVLPHFRFPVPAGWQNDGPLRQSLRPILFASLAQLQARHHAAPIKRQPGKRPAAPVRPRPRITPIRWTRLAIPAR